MITIPFPQAPRVIASKDNCATFSIEGLYPGYGITLANALRRVILSSLPGAGVIAVKIKNVDHEFSAIPGVMEDAISILLNIKKIRALIHEEGVFEGTLNIKGEGEVRAKDFTVPSQIEIVNPNLHIASLTDKKAELQITIWISYGIGYELSEEHTVKPFPQGVGVLKIDTLFSPVIGASFEIDNMRVGDRTDYNKITFKVETDGIITPQEAFETSVRILLEQFDAIKSIGGAKKEEDETKESNQKNVGEDEEKAMSKDASLSGRFFTTNLKLSSRIEKILKKHRVKTIAQLAQKNEEELMKMDGIGEAAVKEIKRKLGKAGFLLGIK